MRCGIWIKILFYEWKVVYLYCKYIQGIFQPSPEGYKTKKSVYMLLKK